MTVSEVIRPGDKIDISLMQHMERSAEDCTIPRTYKSKVLDLKENGNLEIAMPSEGESLFCCRLESVLSLCSLHEADYIVPSGRLWNDSNVRMSICLR